MGGINQYGFKARFPDMVRQGKVFRDNEATMAELTKQERGRIVGLVEAGMSVRAAAHQVGTTPATASKWWNRYQATGNVDDLPRSGRPRVTSAAQDASIVNKATQNRTLTGET